MVSNPSQDELAALIDKGMGSLLPPAEVENRKKSGELPDNFKVADGFGVYRVDVGGNEYLCVTNILCEKCQRLNGKVKRCEQHKRKRRPRRSSAEPDGSDREKINNLRHLDDDDDEEEKIDGAVTPDAVMTVGIGGAIILVPVDAKNNERAGPQAKNMNHVKGILVRGPGYLPQFIPNDRLTKAHKLRFDNYIEGELVVLNGKEVFVPGGLNPGKMDAKSGMLVAKNSVADKVDQKQVDQIGKDQVVAVQVDVADNGMPVMKVLEGKPKDKETPVGIVLKVNDQNQFIQIAGRELGGGKDAKMLPCTIPENAKVGDVVADIYVTPDGKGMAAKPGEVPKGNEQIGQVVVGMNEQLVYVPKGADKDECIRRAAGITPAQREKMEKDQIRVQAAVTGQSPEHIQQQINYIGGAAANQKNGQSGGGGGQGGDIRSVGFGNHYGGSVSAKQQPGGGGYGGGGAGGPGGVQRGAGGEVRSLAFGANQYGRSVQAKALPGGGGGYSGGAGQAGGYSGGAGQGAGQTGGYSGSAGAGGGVGAQSAGAGGPRGSSNDVASVAFQQQYGGSVHVIKKGGGAYGAPSATGGVPMAGSPARNSGAVGGGGGQGAKDQQSVMYNQQFGASVYMRK